MFAHQIGNLIGPARQLLLQSIAGRHIEPTSRNPYLIDSWQAVVDMRAALEFEDDAGSGGEDQCIANRVMHGPDLHIR